MFARNTAATAHLVGLEWETLMRFAGLERATTLVSSTFFTCNSLVLGGCFQIHATAVVCLKRRRLITQQGHVKDKSSLGKANSYSVLAQTLVPGANEQRYSVTALATALASCLRRQRTR
jgi:hypothetical protein